MIFCGRMDRESVFQGCSASNPNSAYWKPYFWGRSCISDSFRYFVVIDFEATCDKDTIPEPQEIIEFPSVIVDGITGNIVAYFQIYVRPTYNQQLTDFCKALTGIQQNQVDTGVSLRVAIRLHDEWLEKLGIKTTKFAVVTWSNWDCKVMLESECRYKKIAKPSYFDQWINLRVPFHQIFGSVKCTLKEAVELSGLIWTGRAHSGLDDATNTARLLAMLLFAGANLRITDSLNKQQVVENQPCSHQKHGGNLYPLCYCGVVPQKMVVKGKGESVLVCGNWSPLRKYGSCKFFQVYI